MLIEHNVHASQHKSPYEEEDLSSSDLRYVVSRSNDESNMQDEENPIGNSTMLSDYQEESRSSFLLPHEVKFEPLEQSNIVFGKSRHSEQQIDRAPPGENRIDGELSYFEFKSKYIKHNDGATYNCLACHRSIMKTSVCAHLRLWHATSMMYNCELCNIGFRRADYRSRHMAAQHPDDYKCNDCNIQLNYSGLYIEHMQEAHRKIIKNVQK